MVLAYNHEKYIRKALESIIVQKTKFPFEIVIHEDQSTDATISIIKEYEDKYPGIVKPSMNLKICILQGRMCL